MQIRCSSTSVILVGRYDRRTALTRRHKNAQKKHTRPHSRTPLGRMIHKVQSSSYLAAHNCTTSGLRAAFQFREILGSSNMYLTRNGNQKLLQKLDCNSPEKEPLGRASCRWNDNITMHLIKTTREGIISLQVAQIKRYWWDLTNMIIIFFFFNILLTVHLNIFIS